MGYQSLSASFLKSSKSKEYKGGVTLARENVQVSRQGVPRRPRVKKGVYRDRHPIRILHTYITEYQNDYVSPTATIFIKMIHPTIPFEQLLIPLVAGGL